ncbi:unnamed protein product [Arctogadus glacialis]
MIGGVMMRKQRAVLTSMQGSSHGSVGRCSGAADGSLVRTRPHQGLLRTAVPTVGPRWEPGLEGVDLEGVDLEGVDLEGVDLTWRVQTWRA